MSTSAYQSPWTPHFIPRKGTSIGEVLITYGFILPTMIKGLIVAVILIVLLVIVGYFVLVWFFSKASSAIDTKPTPPAPSGGVEGYAAPSEIAQFRERTDLTEMLTLPSPQAKLFSSGDAQKLRFGSSDKHLDKLETFKHRLVRNIRDQ